MTKIQNRTCPNIPFNDIVWVIGEFEFRICFEFGVSDFEFDRRIAKMKTI